MTAKLSKQFYDKLGDQVANELVDWFNQVDTTYRSELRELNESNFARFEAKLEQQMSQLRSELIKWMFTLWAGSAVTTVATVWGVVSLLK